MKHLFLVCLIVLATSCSRSDSSASEKSSGAASASGTVSIDAKISAGTRFILYCNDVWSAPQQLPVVPGEWKTYQFRVPQELKSLRFDPTELAEADVEIRSVKFDYVGQPPRWMPLTDLPKWLQYNSKVTLDSASGPVRIHTTDTDMYIMSTVNVAYYLLKPQE